MAESEDHTVEYIDAVLSAARSAWRWLGEDCRVTVSTAPGSSILGAIELVEKRCVEVFLRDVPVDAAELIADWRVSTDWSLRALVPINALGAAHDSLRDFDCELQSYWHDENRVVFGSVEIA